MSRVMRVVTSVVLAAVALPGARTNAQSAPQATSHATPQTAARALAKDATFTGVITTVESAAVLIAPAGARNAPAVVYDMTPATTVTRGGATVPFAKARIAVGETVTITVKPGDEARTEYRCPMKSDKDVVEAAPGKCPKCGMSLRPESRPARAANLQFAK